MIFSLRRMRAVARKEFRHLFRDPRMRPVIFVAPVIQLVVLGIAANMDVLGVDVVVVDRDQSAVSREIVQRIDANTAFEVWGVTTDEAVAERALDRGQAELVVVLPEGTARGLARNEPVDLPVWVDGTDTNRGMLAQGYLQNVLDAVSSERLDLGGQAMSALVGGRPEPRVRVLYNPALQSRWFMVPGILVLVLAVITMLLSALAVVKEKEQGTIEQLSVTPIRPAELLLGKLAPFLIVGVIVAVLVTVAAVLAFGVPLLGNPLELLGMILLFILSTMGLGLLASTVSQTQQQALLSAVLILLPSMLLGGVFYPISNMPMWAQRLADLTPIRWFIAMVRAVFLKGVGFETLWREALILGAIGVLVLAFAIFRFRKRSA
ncbi:MAG: ABC transporter permease [Deltaproteobacteria bacterium]|nr:ABC transporter permease [Deltaproteobacteria bacterium]MBW2255288.1 ABC transporter permease [Deltaproteobacteria bacterium]